MRESPPKCGDGGERVLAAGVGAEIEAEVEDELVVGQTEIGALHAGFGRRNCHRRRHQKDRLCRRRRDRIIGEPAGGPHLLNKREGGSPLLGEFGQLPGPIADRIAPLDAAFPQKQVIEECGVGIQVQKVDAGRLGERGGRPAVLRSDRSREAIEHRPWPGVPSQRERAHAQIFGAPGDEAGISDQAKVACDCPICGRFWRALRDAVIEFEFLDPLADPPLEQSRSALRGADRSAPAIQAAAPTAPWRDCRAARRRPPPRVRSATTIPTGGGQSCEASHSAGA